MKNQRLLGRLGYAGLLLLSTAALAGCGGGKNEVKVIQKSGVLRVAMQDENVTENGETSREMALAKQIAEALKVEVQTVPVSSIEEASTKLIEKEADIAIGGIPSEVSHEKDLTISDAYETEPWYVVTMRGDYSDSVAAFTGRTLGVSSTLADDSLSWMVGDDTIELGKVQPDDALTYLTTDNIAGFVCHREEAQWIVGLSADVQVQPMQNALPEEMVILLRSSDDTFLNGINTVIAQSQQEMETTQEGG